MRPPIIAAHSPPVSDSEDWHDLVEHLKAVAKCTQWFARAFGGGDFGSSPLAQIAGKAAYYAGLLHDIGKAPDVFQEYLWEAFHRGRKGGPPHAVWGAALLYNQLGERWPLELALPIAGHHGGLRAPKEAEQRVRDQLRQRPADWKEVIAFLPQLPVEVPRLPMFSAHQREFLTRMLLSALVDADRLDTEEHFKKHQAKQRKGFTSLKRLMAQFEKNQQRFLKEVEEKMHDADEVEVELNRIRRKVYDECRGSASLPPGFFRLAVPTGGAKTRGALAFALHHALKHGLERIVVALPYTSLIDQTADTYIEIFGPNDVVVHHSRVPLPKEDEAQDPGTVRRRLATENWDAPIILTTTVQLFESLLSNHPSRVRKIHRLARSVIVLDEVQTLPVSFLEPTLDVLRTLADDYGASVVLSTATQPGFEGIEGAAGLDPEAVRDLVPEPKRFFEAPAMQRVRYDVRRDGKIAWDDLADKIAKADETQVLAVLNTRRDAIKLYKAVEAHSPPELLHLSTLLCGLHRRHVLEKLKTCLDREKPKPVILVSTQVVEAGMDLDFAAVYRALGPLDRIVQAAGRCNRGGHRGIKGGRVVVFEPKNGGTPQGPYETGFGIAKALLKRHEPDDLKTQVEYFERLFREEPLDKRGIQDLREELNFPEVAKRYQWMADTVPVVVTTYGGERGEQAEPLLEEYRHSPGRDTRRALRPFIVEVYPNQLHALASRSDFEEVTEDTLFAWHGEYDKNLGLPVAFDDPHDAVPVYSGGIHA